nr:hypothetical protein [Tanacetum cinerariifolium]
MGAILEETEHNTDFHQIVDFLEASHIRYALTISLTVYVSHIQQFWSTARIETTNQETKILATADGKPRTISESSLRRHLKLNDEEGISSLPDTELLLMGYNIVPNQMFTFQKGQFSHQWKFLIHTITQCLGPKSTGFNEFSSNIATVVVCLATNRVYNFLKMIFDGMVRNINYEPASLSRDDGQGEAFPTVSRIVPLFDTMLVQQGEGSGTPTEPHHIPSLEAQLPSHNTYTSPTLPPFTTTSLPTITQSDTPIDMATIDKSSTLPHNSTPQEVEINRLKERVKMLEDREGVDATRSEDDASIKGRSMNEGEAATERISDNSEEMATVLTSMDAATVLASGVVDVPTGSGSIPTASTPDEEQVPTGSDVVPTAKILRADRCPGCKRTRRATGEREDQRRSAQIARDVEIARIHAEEELQIMIDGLDRNNETVAKYLQEYHQFALELPIERRIELITDLVKYQDNYAKIYKYQIQQRKPMTKKQNRDYYMAVIKNNLGWKVKDFRGMTFKEVEAKFNSVWKQMEDFIPMGLMEEAERIKRKEVPEEKVKEMTQLVPIEEVYVEALQVKHPIIDWKVYTKGQRSYWKINRRLSPPISDKEMELWVELSRLYKPNNEDQLWTHTQNFMHAPVEWKLYDTCGVHHVTSKDKEIFMLVEKYYPLRKGLALLMISYKLQVENYSQMANDLILKI